MTPRVYSTCSGCVQDDDTQAAKFGIQTSAFRQVVAWRLVPLQETAPCRHPRSEQLYVIVSGEGWLHYDRELSNRPSEYMPSPTSVVEPPAKDLDAKLDATLQVGVGDVIVVPENAYHSFRAHDSGMTFIGVTTPPSFNSFFLPR